MNSPSLRNPKVHYRVHKRLPLVSRWSKWIQYTLLHSISKRKTPLGRPRRRWDVFPTGILFAFLVTSNAGQCNFKPTIICTSGNALNLLDSCLYPIFMQLRKRIIISKTYFQSKTGPNRGQKFLWINWTSVRACTHTKQHLPIVSDVPKPPELVIALKASRK